MAAVASALAPWIADAFVVLGVIVMTIGVYGMIRMPDPYTSVHAAGKAVFLGVISLLVASVFTGELSIILRVVLIGIFLIITTPVASHVIGKAAFVQRERMRSPAPVDESGANLQRGRKER